MCLRRAQIFFCVIALAALTRCSDGAPSADSGTNADVLVDGSASDQNGSDVASDTREDGEHDSDWPDRDLPVDPPEDHELDSGEIDSGNPLAIVDPIATVNPANMLSYYVEWDTTVPTATQLQVDCGDSFQNTLADPAETTRHTVFAMGFWTGAECDLVIEASYGDWAASETLQITVDALPEFLPTLEIADDDALEMHEGWTLFNLNNHYDRIPLKVVLIDDEGRYRWYHSRELPKAGAETDTRTVSEGVLIGGWGSDTHPAIVDWEGDIVWEGPFGGTHDVRYNEVDRTFFYIRQKYECPEDNRASEVVLWDRDAEVELWSWAICEHFVPDPYQSDWSHVNTVEPFPDGDHLLLSSRGQHALFLIDQTQAFGEELVWVLGQVGDFTLVQQAPEDPDPNFFRQHAPERLENGRILMFDNGRYGYREFSRALEIAYNEETMEAWAVWEFVPEPQIFCPIWGDADRLANGNTLVTCGVRSKVNQSHVIEVTPAGDEVWHVTFPLNWGLYRSERVVDLPVGYVVPEAEPEE